MCPTGEQADSGGRQGWQHYSFFCGDAQSRVSHKLGIYIFFPSMHSLLNFCFPLSLMRIGYLRLL
jgi:hypothetical protein